MQVQRIQSNNNNYNNYQRNQNFKARFSAADIEKLITDARNQQSAKAMPQLYTMLKYLDEFPQRVAKIVKNTYTAGMLSIHTRISIGEEDTLLSNITQDSPFAALKKACVEDSEFTIFSHLRMPQQIFLQEWWNNRRVTEDDVRALTIRQRITV